MVQVVKFTLNSTIYHRFSVLSHNMKTYTLFKEYIWLVNIIHRRGRISLSEINKEWLFTDMSEGTAIARNTFLRHKNAIEDIFGIIIECDTHHDYKYYISNRHVLAENSIQNWMLSAITVNNILTENVSLADRILLETVPSESSFLSYIIDAMRHKVRIQLTYQKYDCDNSSTVTIAPYCLRLFQCRWYLLGQFQRPIREGEKPTGRKGVPKGYIEYYVTYSLDRVKEIHHTEEKFEINKNFSATEYFKDCFGVYRDDSIPVQRILIRAYDLQRYYMRDLPWHHSQKEKYWGEEYADYEFTLRPTNDFIRFIMRYGSLVKVITPIELARKVKTQLLEAADMYKDLDETI